MSPRDQYIEEALEEGGAFLCAYISPFFFITTLVYFRKGLYGPI